LHAKTAESLTEPMTESDPIFSAWDKTTGVEISESQISDFGAYIESETDPVFTSWNKSYYDLTNKPNIIDSLTTVLDTITQFVRTEIDGSVTNEIQNLTQVLAQDNDGGALQIKNIANPTDSQDVTTKAYVDMLLAKIEALEEREAEFLIINGFTDSRDGIHYDVIRIGEQIWMAQNLKATRYSDGAQIQLEEDGANWSSLTTGAYCWLNNDSVSYAQTYGALYNYYAVVSDKLCPIGWHVPSDSEWLELVNFITADGYVGEEGTALKSTSGWTSTGSGTDIYGFNALPGGERNWSDGAFIGEGGRGYWWSSTAHDSGNAYARYLNFSLTYVVRSNYENNLGFSVRCLRD